uniref:Uncharacterized protein n=1 Tax=Anguilla anguilla TaxID=7936 RepID=A0A0E9XHS4_ANGAN
MCDTVLTATIYFQLCSTPFENIVAYNVFSFTSTKILTRDNTENERTEKNIIKYLNAMRFLIIISLAEHTQVFMNICNIACVL